MSRQNSRQETVIGSDFSAIDIDDITKQIQRLITRTLESVAADDRAICAAITHRPHFIKKPVTIFCSAAREHHDPASGKRGLHLSLIHI